MRECINSDPESTICFALNFPTIYYFILKYRVSFNSIKSVSKNKRRIVHQIKVYNDLNCMLIILNSHTWIVFIIQTALKKCICSLMVMAISYWVVETLLRNWFGDPVASKRLLVSRSSNNLLLSKYCSFNV